MRQGTEKAIAESIYLFLVGKSFDLDQLKAIGCDGTATNIGCRNGVIRNLELKLNRPLQWFICLLHANELPLRHLFIKLDGET